MASNDTQPIMPAPESLNLPTTTGLKPTRHTRHGSATKIQDDVEDILRVLNRPGASFAKEFVLNNDPSANVHMLTAPYALSNACTASVEKSSLANVASTQSSYNTALFVPCFSSGSCPGSKDTRPPITVGLMVLITRPPPGLMPEPLDVKIGRYWLNNLTNERVEVLWMPAPNGVMTTFISCLRVGSTTETDQTLVAFDSTIFEQAIRANEASALSSAAAFSFAAKLRHDCVVCGAGHVSACDCVVPCDLPTHALDYATLGPSLTRYGADNRGIGCFAYNRFRLTSALSKLPLWWSRLSGMNDSDPSEMYSPVASLPMSMKASIGDKTIRISEVVNVGLTTLMSRVNLLANRAPSEPRFPTDLAMIRATNATVQESSASPVSLGGSESSSPTTPSPAEVSELSHRVQKQFERREKNRQSAARANARRKEELLKRRAELEAGRVRVAELRIREAELREQNAALRSQFRAKLKNHTGMTEAIGSEWPDMSVSEDPLDSIWKELNINSM